MPNSSASWLSRRTLIITGAAPVLFACSSDPNSDSAAMVSMMKQSLGNLMGNGAVTREEAAQVPFASIGVRIGGANQDLLVLAMQSRDVCLWNSGSHVALETRNGRIVRTSGFPHDSVQTAASGKDPLQLPLRLDSENCEYEFDFADRGVYRARVRYEMRREGQEKIDILGSTLDVLRHSEKGECSLLDWRFRNDFWIDPANGFVWRSIQFIHPDMDALEVVVFRPPA